MNVSANSKEMKALEEHDNSKELFHRTLYAIRNGHVTYDSMLAAYRLARSQNRTRMNGTHEKIVEIRQQGEEYEKAILGFSGVNETPRYRHVALIDSMGNAAHSNDLERLGLLISELEVEMGILALPDKMETEEKRTTYYTYCTLLYRAARTQIILGYIRRDLENPSP